jgi:hypothetical protein
MGKLFCPSALAHVLPSKVPIELRTNCDVSVNTTPGSYRLNAVLLPTGRTYNYHYTTPDQAVHLLTVDNVCTLHTTHHYPYDTNSLISAYNFYSKHFWCGSYLTKHKEK